MRYLPLVAVLLFLGMGSAAIFYFGLLAVLVSASGVFLIGVGVKLVVKVLRLVGYMFVPKKWRHAYQEFLAELKEEFDEGKEKEKERWRHASPWGRARIVLLAFICGLLAAVLLAIPLYFGNVPFLRDFVMRHLLRIAAARGIEGSLKARFHRPYMILWRHTARWAIRTGQGTLGRRGAIAGASKQQQSWRYW
jgi:hypothetical protein